MFVLKDKKCKICKNSYTPTRQLQPTCEKFQCQLDYANKHLKKSELNKKKQINKEKKDFYAKDVTTMKMKAQKIFNQYIRERDKHLFCISCQKPNDGAFDCGHFKPRGGFSALAFNEDNCSGQCKKCNRFLSANLIDYRKNLIIKIGLERVEFLETCTQTKKWTTEELTEIIEKYRLKYKKLKEVSMHDKSRGILE